MPFRRTDLSSDSLAARGASKPPRLVLRFAVVTALGMALAGAGILLFVRHHETVQAESAVAFHARFVAESILREEMERSDFETTVDGERFRQLDELFRDRVLSGPTVRVRLLAPDGTVTYSNDQALVGAKAPDIVNVRAALRGTMVTDIADVRAQTGNQMRALVVYLPVRFGGGQPAGVFELSQDYAPIAKSVREVFLPIAGVLQAVLIALFVSLFPLLHGVTKTLRRQMRMIHHQAVHDDLTTLPNRAFFRERVEAALREARASGSGFTIMLIDLDRFKEVNDTLGHQSGDELLQELGSRLRTLLRSSDVMARLGGDEFAVLAPEIRDAVSARRLADRIRSAIEEPFVIKDLTLNVGASIGIAFFPEHGDDVDALVRRADVAMYVSKTTHLPKIYDAEDDHYTLHRLTLGAELRRAIDERELVVHYQPCADVRTGELHAVEALVRWQHPELGLLPPDKFIPLAEGNGLIRELTEYVLDTALGQLRALHDQGFDFQVSVNLSGRDVLDLGLPDQVSALLAKWEVDAGRLELEVSENTILDDPARAHVVLTRLNERNVVVAIDDFGTGYSSLRYLRRLPINVIKIDKSFVLNMTSDESDAVIIRSTIGLGHDLGLQVVAEGVETEETWSRLAELGCDTAQGFYLSRPLDASALSKWLQKVADAHYASAERQVRPGGPVVVLAASGEETDDRVVPLRPDRRHIDPPKAPNRSRTAKKRRQAASSG